ncbi:MAG: hypothetical protein GC145_12315 [Caulobacter sp.]|nr:hypothetical protein [Caulobacter sp.]
MDDSLTLELTRASGFDWRGLADALLASVPLAALSVILFRNGRRGAWPGIPWVLAAVCAPAWLAGFGALPGIAVTSPKMLLFLTAAGWTEGARASLFLVVVWLAIFGVHPKPVVQRPDPPKSS